MLFKKHFGSFINIKKCQNILRVITRHSKSIVRMSLHLKYLVNPKLYLKPSPERNFKSIITKFEFLKLRFWKIQSKTW